MSDLPPVPPVNAQLPTNSEQQQDFQFVHGEPTLPQGASNLPNWEAAMHAAAAGQPAPQPVYQPDQPAQPPAQPDPSVVNRPYVQPSEQFIAQTSLLPPEDQILIQQWFQYCWYTNSPYLDGALIKDPNTMIKHIHGMLKDQADQARQAAKDKELEASVALKEKRLQTIDTKNANRAKWEAYLDECRARKDMIERAHAEWDKRRAEMAAVQKQMEEALKPWHEYVNAARVAYVDAKASPAPKRPDIKRV